MDNLRKSWAALHLHHPEKYIGLLGPFLHRFHEDEYFDSPYESIRAIKKDIEYRRKVLGDQKERLPLPTSYP